MKKFLAYTAIGAAAVTGGLTVLTFCIGVPVAIAVGIGYGVLKLVGAV